MQFAEAVSTAPSYLTTLLWLAPVPPIVAFGLIALFFNRMRRTASTIAVIAAIASLVMSYIIFFNVWQQPELGKAPIGSSIPWIPTGDTTLNIGVTVDPLSATFLFMVPLACTLIIIYSTSYMSADPRYPRFFAYMSLFMGSMMGLVVSDNLLSLFIFWELMGFCSYSLIGFFYQKPSAYKAAVKAFMTTRVGDMLLLLGMVYLYDLTGTLNFHDILHNEEVLNTLAATPAVLGLGISAAGLITLLIFGGTVGKSAQFPLHVWLPDAMEGPTPVSAMIHAAAMVSAGIFLLLRFFPLLQATGIPGPESTIIGLIGAFTAFMGATIAVAQYDIKRVLAFSTISQLGFMVAAIGTGAAHGAHGEETHGHPAAGGHDAPQTAGAALAVAHDAKDAHDAHAEPSTGSGHVEEFDPQDMRNMGGLRKKMPITFITFLIGGLALAGFPFITAGFWSKDEIFADAWHAFSAEGHLLAGIVFFTLAFTALLTAFYTMRQIALIFFGKPRTEAAGHASESSPAMTIPLIVLAFFALTIGFVNIPSDFPIFGSIAGEFSYYLKDLLKQSLIEKPETLEFNIVPVTFSVVVSLLGLTLGFLVYRGRRLEAGVTDPVEKLGGLFRFLQNRWYWDELYRKIFINPLQKIADAYSRIIDQGIIDKILEGVYRLGGAIAGAFAAFDRVVITGISDTVGRVFRIAGDWGRELQSGQVQNYLLSGLIMALAILVFFLFFFQ